MIATAMVRGTSVVDVVADRAYVITKTEVKCKMHMSGNFMRYAQHDACYQTRFLYCLQPALESFS